MLYEINSLSWFVRVCFFFCWKAMSVFIDCYLNWKFWKFEGKIKFKNSDWECGFDLELFEWENQMEA